MKYFNKRAIEVATGTIVLLIVGIVILGLATSLTYTIFCGAQDYAAQIDGQSEQRIEQLLAGGGAVQVARNTQTARQEGNLICGLDRDRSALFALGIQNTDQNQDITFYIDIERASPLGVADDNEIQHAESVTVAPRETATQSVLIVLPADANDQHVYTVRVREGSSTGTIHGVQQLYVNPE